MYINTILGKKHVHQLGIILPHEHVCCYFEYYLMMAGKKYLDKKALLDTAAKYLSEMKEKYALSAIIDCTAVNIGRDLDLLKEASTLSGVDIISSTGFYYTDEIMTRRHSEEYIEEQILEDVAANAHGIIKFAVQTEKMTEDNKHMLSVLCEVQKKTGIPLCVHTNAHAQNGTEVLGFVLDRKVDPAAVTIAHCSDTRDMGYVSDLLSSGCYVGFDRIRNSDAAEYYADKAYDISVLCIKGYSSKILLSHDGLCYNGFNDNAKLASANPYTPIFEKLLPAMRKTGFDENAILSIISDNPKNMLLAI